MAELIYIFLIIMGYFTAYVVSLYSLAIFIDPDEVKLLFPKVSKKRKEFITKLADDPRVFTQIAIIYKSFILIIISVFAVSLLSSLSDEFHTSLKISIPVGLVVIWLLYIFFVELLPRKASRDVISLNLLKRLWLIEIVYKMFLPIINIYRNSLKKSGEKAHATEEEKDEIIERAIEALADEAGISENIVEEDEKEMITQIFQLDQTIVKEIMIPRIDITGIEEKISYKEIQSLVLKEGFSRYPVFVKSIDKIIGILYIKDLFSKMPEPGEKFNIHKYLKRPYFVPESKIIRDLLKEFKARHLHIAIVVDEYGGVAGLVTLEDIIEEIVGDIQDEHDLEEAEFSKLADGSYLANAAMLVKELQDFFDTEYEQEESETIGGLIYDLVGSVPELTQKIRWNSFIFEIESIKGQRILRVKVKKI
ncbi:MAG: hypothetical protein DRP35_01415 [Candidatus Zixiibacteriota bacterium]|nr:MAG: hypothetical protein DRP35_01415 [candidate division Zixibacteria bacterium]